MKKVIKFILGPFRFTVERLKNRYRVRYKFNKKHLGADIFFLLSIIGLVIGNVYISLVLVKFIVSLKVKVEVAVSPEVVISGDLITYTVDYANTNPNQGLKDGKIKLELPPNFKFISSSSSEYNSADNVFNLGDLKEKTSGEFQVIGEIWGNVGEEQKVYAVFDYLQESGVNKQVNWRDERLTMAKYKIDGSVLDFSVDCPEKVVNRVDFDCILRYKNNYADTLKNVEISHSWPKEYQMTAAMPSFGGDRWVIGDIQSGGSGEIKLAGRLNSAESKPQPDDFIFQVGISHNSSQLIQGEVNKKVEIAYPRLSLRVYRASDEAISLGDSIEYTIQYQNNENEDIKNINLVAKLVGQFFDNSTIAAQEGTVKNNEVTWVIPELKIGESGEKKIKVEIYKNKKNVDWLDKGVGFLQNIVTADYILPSSNLKLVVNAEPFLTPLVSDLSLSSFGRYYTNEGEQLGIGPLPPIVNMPTKYWIFWQVGNHLNDVSDIEVTGVLPDNVIWIEKDNVTAGSNLEYDRNTRMIKWRLGNMGKYSGVANPNETASFAVLLTPVASQIGKNALLLNKIKINGRDETTGKMIEIAAPAINSDLLSDPKAKGRGKVVK